MPNKHKTEVIPPQYLEVKDSILPNCGKGLFTKIPIKKGTVIVEYKGEKITWAEGLKRNENHPTQSPYLFYISANNCIDAEYTLDALARYANDAKGHTRVKGISNNADYTIINKVPYIIATKNIKAGSEIFVSYGKDYWNALKKN
ncbi:MAG: SET domain-containing protein [Bacteroidia bacterium]|nr:SET domain-containing protein [Bacteroidia bacterium]MCZ2247229.1 SET domain-containing protein [Bacteroidia bacterium]